MAGMRAVARRNRGYQILFAIGSVMLGIGLLARLSGGDDGGWIVIGTSELAWIAFCYFGSPALRWRSDSINRGPRRFAFDPDGVTCVALLSESRIRWPFYTALFESDRVFVLLRGGRACTAIPKRAFSSQTDADHFRALAARGMTASPA
jgi:hypothetical protein